MRGWTSRVLLALGIASALAAGYLVGHDRDPSDRAAPVVRAEPVAPVVPVSAQMLRPVETRFNIHRPDPHDLDLAQLVP